MRIRPGFDNEVVREHKDFAAALKHMHEDDSYIVDDFTLDQTAPLTPPVSVTKPPADWKKIAGYGLLIASICFALTAIGYGFYAIYRQRTTYEPAVLNQLTYVYELGEEVTLNKEKYLTGDLRNLEASSSLITDTLNYNYDASTGVVTSRNRNYLAAGTYKIVFQRQSQAGGIETYRQVIEVTDTTPPVFEKYLNEIILTEGEKLPAIDSIFQASDKTEVKLTYDLTTVDTKKAGTYPVTITAADEAGNITEKECRIIIEAGKGMETPKPARPAKAEKGMETLQSAAPAKPEKGMEAPKQAEEETAASPLFEKELLETYTKETTTITRGDSTTTQTRIEGRESETLDTAAVQFSTQAEAESYLNDLRNWGRHSGYGCMTIKQAADTWTVVPSKCE